MNAFVAKTTFSEDMLPRGVCTVQLPVPFEEEGESGASDKAGVLVCRFRPSRREAAMSAQTSL